MEITGRVCADAVIKAAIKLEALRKGSLHPRKAKSKELYIITVDYKHRLVSKDKKSWWLLNHKDYDRILSHCKGARYF